ncbi:MAG: MCE family protein [Bdellovibrionaceae bacterium]|jgi:phospholipid/cholesterol/gamma-HCH transport system substrate-binding protein|nr:MCE family protein [Pseudobdellovibrionaceae bacterium]
MISTPEFKVGVLVVMVSAVIATLSMKVTDGSGLFSNNKKHWFELEDASGLVPESAVRMAGIKIGKIHKIQLVLGKARVTVQIDSEVPVSTSAIVEVRSDGILGDKHVELVPGFVGQEPLKDGDKIANVRIKGSIDKVLEDVSDITKSVSKLADTLLQATHGDQNSSIGRIVLNLEKLTADLAEVSSTNKDQITDIVNRVASISKTIDELVTDESDQGLKAAWGSAVRGLNRFDTSLRNIEEITDKINNGEGTIGRLINDEETVEKLNSTVDNVNDFLGGATDMQTSIDYHSEYMSQPGVTKSYLGVRIQPGKDRYYDIQIIDDPTGVISERDIDITGTTDSSNTERITDKSELKFTVLFAKNFYDFTVKGGIMENAGGLGFDYHFLNKKLQLSMDVFNFEDLNVKSYVKYSFFKGVYIMGGGDHLTNSAKAGGFLGAGLFLTNDDLKIFASKVSF